ncbi:glutamate ABC transporter substrate-binding protein [Nocardia aurantiaca]|uniref:Transporter substrate-binding domain-containing protein n=1 Tax=Nocardia aurantiaca TaxID=2675850 RepID=A0A6I3L0L6_9NOCA|nr:glutamate ABC transporter substrate-binding protein [Nocardia aurantiaca]MTE15822.1 transporter substrate-binding domain-containing protein [Nocardia aurantiaca]
MRMLLMAAVALLAAACGSTPGAVPFQLPPGSQLPPGAAVITSGPSERGDQSCDPTASLRPGIQPQPGAMPAGSTMAAIVASGKLRVGVDQNQTLFGYRNPATGQIEGFDIDIAREVARDLFGDPERVELHPTESANRAPALVANEVDMVVQTFSATCARRKDVQFSTPYLLADQRLLVTKTSGIRSTADLAGKKVCGVYRSTTLDAIFALPQHPTVIGMVNWLDCLTALQQGQVDAVSTDAPILDGLKMQDPNLELVGETMDSDAFAIGIQKQATDFVRFVNSVLQRLRTDGTWQRLYDKWLSGVGPSPGPPATRYSD